MKVGIIGCGFVAPDHIKCVRSVADTEIVGVADIDLKSAQNIAESFNVPKYFTDTATLLAETKPDVVHLLTPPQTHTRLALEVMQAGCHLLLEKPMAPTVAEADIIVEASKEHNVTLGLCHNFIFVPCVQKAKQLIDQGMLGTIVGVDIAWRPAQRGLEMPWTKELPGGPMHEILPHPAYIQREFVGEMQSLVGVSRRTTDPQRADCEMGVLLEAELGTTHLDVSPSGAPKQIMLRITGTKMSLNVEISSNTLIKVRKFGNSLAAKALMNIDQAVQLIIGTMSNAVTLLRGGYSNGHLPLIQAFYKSLRDGSEVPVSGMDGRQTVAILDAIWDKKPEN